MSKSTPVEQNEPSPSNHHLQQFLAFLKHEKGFADATIVNRVRSLKPFLAWLIAQAVPLSTVSPVVITKYFTSAVAGRWRRTTVSFHVQSLRSFFRYASSRGWCAAGIAEYIDAPRVYTHENLPLIDCISVGVDRMQRNFEPMRKQVETWQRSELTDVTGKVVIYEAFVEGKLEAPKHFARTVQDLYFEPNYEEFRRRTIWSLSNAFTSAFKELDPIPQFKATAKLGEFLEARFSQSF